VVEDVGLQLSGNLVIPDLPPTLAARKSCVLLFLHPLTVPVVTSNVLMRSSRIRRDDLPDGDGLRQGNAYDVVACGVCTDWSLTS